MRFALILMLSVFLTTCPVYAQDSWLLDFEMARTKADQKDHNILLVFAGSDWCAPCIKLKKQILDTDEFKSYAADNLVLLEADFPRKKQNKLTREQQNKNNKLAELYNQEGHFPLVVLLDKEGKKLGETGYQNVAPTEYIAQLNSMMN